MKRKTKTAATRSEKPVARGSFLKTLRRVLTLLLLLAIAIAVVIYRDYRLFTETPLAVAGKPVTVDIALGTPLLGVVRQLRAAGLTDAPEFYWRALAWELNAGANLHAGEYAIAFDATPRALLRRMLLGDVMQHKFTIVEGWTFRQLRAALAADDGLRSTLPGVSDAEIMQRLGAGDEAAEGRFLPETYAYSKGQADLDVLKRAHQAQRRELEKIWDGRDRDLPLTSADQLLTLASIVEKETGRGDERPLIAAVFLHRLKIGMRLQTDPTVIYGLGASFDGNLHKRDLGADTPFNTYTRNGLPPTPIALPGKAALNAVAHPALSNALYFVGRGDGRHEFSDTLEAHNRAVAKYQLGHR